ncbi:actinodin3 [Hemitrygon akajei]|uniref:actinodin3 n=1 Tax=Hemitrygon akajei TaxID=2704970 RepID=UPI003BF9E82E
MVLNVGQLLDPGAFTLPVFPQRACEQEGLGHGAVPAPGTLVARQNRFRRVTEEDHVSLTDCSALPSCDTKSPRVMSAQQSTKSLGWLTTTLLAVIVIPDWAQAVSLLDLFKPAKGDEGVRLDPRDAVDFLGHPSGRIRRHIKWYQQNPDFQSWYKYYQKIGHHEGLYEIDRIRLTYLQMRHLETVYGKDAPYYQYTIGMAPAPGKAKPPCDPKRDGSCKNRPSVPMVPVAQPTPAPPNAPPQLSCNLQDPACLLRYFYIFLGRFQGGCDPKTDPKCSRQGMLPCDPKYDSACVPSTSAPHPYTPTEHRCNPVYDAGCNEGDHRGSQRHHPTYHEGQEDDGGSEADDGEADPYVPNYHGYHRVPNYYHRHTNPHGPSSNPNHYNSPNPYDSPNPNSHYSSYNSPYGYPHNSPYGYPHNSPYGSPYGPYYGREDDDGGGEEDDDDY